MGVGSVSRTQRAKPIAGGVESAQRSSSDAPTKASSAKRALRSTFQSSPLRPAGPRPSKFGIAASEFVPLESLFGKQASGGVMNGTFYVAVKDGVPHVQVPLVFSGLNRLTPEYRRQVVEPLMAAYTASGRTLDSLMDPTDHNPSEAELTPAFASGYARALASELERCFATMGVKAEVPMEFRDIPLTPFEARLMGGAKPTKAALANPAARMSEILWSGRSAKFRDPKDFTFLLQPVPNLKDAYTATGDYNPTVGAPVSAFAHEMGHYLFMGAYEGYQDAFSPPGAVMGDTAAHRVAASQGKPIAFSSTEQVRVLEQIVAAAAQRGQDTQALEKRIQALTKEVEATEANSVVGTLARDGTFTVSPGGRKLAIDTVAFAALFEKADLKKPLLVVFDSTGEVSHLNAWQKPRIMEGQKVGLGYGKFMPGEVGLTSGFVAGIIKAKLTAPKHSSQAAAPR
jgi:hypothetical protein